MAKETASSLTIVLLFYEFLERQLKQVKKASFGDFCFSARTTAKRGRMFLLFQHQIAFQRSLLNKDSQKREERFDKNLPHVTSSSEQKCFSLREVGKTWQEMNRYFLLLTCICWKDKVQRVVSIHVMKDLSNPASQLFSSSYHHGN